MNIDEWLRFYDNIRRKLGYSIIEDQNAARILSKLIKGKEVQLDKVKEIIYNKNVFVIGAGPSLESFNSYDLIKEYPIIAADGATEALLRNGIKPSIVVTDLDGNSKALLEASKLGSIMIIHAHGDNINRMLNLVPKFKNCIGTTQVKPFDNIYNFGGFTDGDRAVFLANKFFAKSIILIGMDFGNKIGTYSKQQVINKELKIEKMRIAKELLEYLSKDTKTKLYNLSFSNIKGYTNINDLKMLEY
jgi:hypothetical protein